MQVIAKTFLPDAKRWAAKLQRRRTLSTLPWRNAPLRQFAWTLSLIARFAHSAGLASSSEQTLLRRARVWMLRSHWFVPQIQVAWQTLVAGSWEREDRTLLLLRSPEVLSDRTTLHQTLLTRTHQWHSTLPLSTGFVRNSVQSHTREITRHQLAAMVVARTRASGAIAPFQVGTFTAARTGTGAANSEMLPLAKRLLRQNYRIEEQMAPCQTVLVRHSSPAVREEHFMDASVPVQTRSAGVTAAWVGTPVPQGFNTNQITDEVVRQLDSRLLASRERFGKI